MTHYLNLHLRTEHDIAHHALLSRVYQHLHRGLQGELAGKIGVSFPNHRGGKAPFLGEKIRLHGTPAHLEEIKAHFHLGFRDYIRWDDLAAVPDGCQFRQVRRVQVKSSIPRLVRRYARRHQLSYEEALKNYQNRREERLDLPYIQLQSGSTGQQFLLFIEHGPLEDVPRKGSFSSYGLSSGASVPWF